ncbi:Ig-like domain-containing protein [Cellulophaga sp. Z1A5H]|uniref:Ig-like domain-containing protein n=1 Tax=Cellulophaga sp. Z1A5H TaxID=2687291 RepID=UPI0013FD9DAA|nr:Ig-like domain-containing protein [Cellulophaga sp. Z1A5H]
MKTTTKYILGLIAILALIIACTKEVGLYTEVEFEISETHEADGFINTPLATSITVTPEELVEGYSYFYSYKINSGEGYFQDESGTTIGEGDKIGLNPLSAALNYIATKIGDHSITFTAEDTFGFQEQVTASYTISDVPVSWTATGPSGQVLLGTSQDITVVLGSETTATGVTYERNYSFTQGTGTITSSPSGANETLNEFVSITPGTFTLTYVATALGQTTLEFLLRDSNGQEILQTVSFEVVDELSTEKEITSFIVNGVAGTITGTTIDVVLPEGTDLTALAPVIIHNGASISPESEANQDFSNPVIYTVTAQDETIQAYTVNCSSNISVASVAITPNPVTINIGETENLSVATTPTNATNQNVTWTSSDDAIASVSATGVVTGNAIGTATITVTTEDGDFTASSIITVQAATFAVTGITVDPTAITITNGSTTTLNETIAPANATNQNVTWSSSDDAIASVSATGVVTGNAIGTATITVTTEDGGFTATSTITVQSATFAVTGITVDPTAITITNGSTTTLNETIAPANAMNQNVTWTSSDDAIASVSATGVVTGNAIGTATITVTTEDGGFTATSTITVQSVTFAVTGITVDPTAITITNGSTTTLTETIAPANATNQNVTWSSDNTSVATVNPSGVVTSVGVGDAKITVTTEDGGFTATSLVTVEAPANQAPTAVASSDVISGILDLVVKFTGSTSSDPDASDVLTYAWDFGDGAFATTSNPSHTFTTAGKYTVTLTVSDDGTPILNNTDTITITVGEPDITAFVDAGEDMEVAPFFDQFTLNGSFSGSTTVSSILWEEISTGSSIIVSPNSFNTNVTITSGGTYIYKLTVIDNLGGQGSDIIEVNVILCNSCSSGQSRCYDPATKTCSCSGDFGPGPVTALCEF